jgi:hypothetical protein
MGIKSLVVFALMVVLGWSAGTTTVGEERARLRPLPKLDQNVKTGPAVGSHIPPFEAVDQNGRKQTFETLRGPKGAVLSFYRSADW